MAMIAKTLAKTGGNADGAAFMEAIKGYTSASPRGSFAIDPATRVIVQTMYIRRIDKQGARLVATEIDKYEGVKDPGKEAAK
jgi:branched-chain amino acid transport system substrate-binding protein